MLLWNKPQKKLGSWKLYKIYFKEEYETDPMIISENLKEEIELKVKNKDFFQVWDYTFNPYWFLKIEPYSESFDINAILKQEPKIVQDRVKLYMKYDKKNKLTKARFLRMLEKAKEEFNF